MKKITGLLLVVSALCIHPLHARAATAPARSNWLPFSSKSSKPATKTSKAVRSKTTKTPQVVTKMTDGTKKLVSNTKNVLTPKKAVPARKKMPGGYSIQPKDHEPSFMQKMMHPEPPPPPKTIKEWMSLKQIHP